MVRTDEICGLSAVDLAALMREKALSAAEVTRAFLERIDRLNPSLNAYVTLCPERAMAEARDADEKLRRGGRAGPLHGIPFSVKDVVWTEGIRTTAGSRLYENFVPDLDAVLVARLRKAGAVLLGKTNTPEFGYKASTENAVFGATRNPWASDRTAGGSSGGAAAASAAGLSPLSVGTDGGGSIRIPASFCGVFGLKPTFGRIPGGPGFGGWKTLSQSGPITRTVRDAALMLDVMAGAHEGDRVSIPSSSRSYLREIDRPPKRLRVGYSSDLGFAHVDGEVRRVVEAALPAFEDAGHRLRRPSLDLSLARETFGAVVLAENAGLHHRKVAESRSLLDEGFVKFTEMGLRLSAIDYVEATCKRDVLASRMEAFFRTCDILVTPAVAVPPFPIGQPPREFEGKAIEPIDWIPFTYPFNLTGNPAASVPCGFTSDGLPVGLQVVGPRHADGLVLRVCEQFENARPFGFPQLS